MESKLAKILVRNIPYEVGDIGVFKLYDGTLFKGKVVAIQMAKVYLVVGYNCEVDSRYNDFLFRFLI